MDRDDRRESRFAALEPVRFCGLVTLLIGRSLDAENIQIIGEVFIFFGLIKIVKLST
jgi:hypothetical protein